MQISYTLKREMADYDLTLHIHKAGFVDSQVNDLIRQFMVDLEELKLIDQERIKKELTKGKDNHGNS